MTKAEKQTLIYAMENCINRETRLCEECIKLNPSEEKRLENDKNLVILGIQSMYYEVKKQLEGEQ